MGQEPVDGEGVGKSDDGGGDEPEDGDDDVAVSKEDVGGFTSTVFFVDQEEVAADRVHREGEGEDQAGVGLGRVRHEGVDGVAHDSHSGGNGDLDVEEDLVVGVEAGSGGSAFVALLDELAAAFGESEHEGDEAGTDEEPSGHGFFDGGGAHCRAKDEAEGDGEDVGDGDPFELEVIEDLEEQVNADDGEGGQG